MLQQLVLLVAFTLTTSFSVDDPVESIKKKITKAETSYTTELAKVQDDVIKWLDGREVTARKKGDKATVNTVKQQREKLETEGTIPKPIPVNMTRKIDTARDILDASYASLMKEALVANLDDLAGEIEDKRVELSKDKPSFRLVSHMVKNLVENGSFEFPEVPKGANHTRLDGNGWDSKNHDVVKFDGAVPIHGFQMLQLGGEITQQVRGFVPGERYVVTAFIGTYASLNHPNNVSTVSVSIAGEKAEATATATNKGSKNPYVMTGAGSNKWEQISFVFKALGDTHELRLKVESSTNAGLATIDQVSILPFLNK